MPSLANQGQISVAESSDAATESESVGKGDSSAWKEEKEEKKREGRRKRGGGDAIYK